MKLKASALISSILILPFLLGVGIVGYWYWTTRIDKQVMLPLFGEVPAFALTADDRRQVTDDLFRGKVSIVDFIFTECGGTCPMMSTKMADLQSVLRDERHVQFVSVSVDPETDTPDVLAEYGSRYGAVRGKWMFLTGPKEAIMKLTREGFHLGLDIEGDGAIIHSQKFVLVDQRGAIRGYYDSEDAQDMKNLLRDAGLLSRKMAS
jgi:protein SCO1/2